MSTITGILLFLTAVSLIVTAGYIIYTCPFFPGGDHRVNRHIDTTLGWLSASVVLGVAFTFSDVLLG